MEVGGPDPSSNPAGAALDSREMGKTHSPYQVCLLGTGSDFLCGRLRIATSDPAHIKNVKPITHYEAIESCFSFFFSFHEWNRTKTWHKRTWGSVAVVIMTEFPC